MTTDVKNTVLAERAEAEELLVVGMAMFTRPLPGVTPSMLQRPSLRAVLKTYLDNPGQVENTQSFQDELRKKILQLPDTQRKVLHMFYFEGLRLKDIGELLGFTEARA